VALDGVVVSSPAVITTPKVWFPSMMLEEIRLEVMRLLFDLKKLDGVIA
jgi:hypothetical protein